MEIEADHIGIMLLGAAGFHPSIALVVLWKLAKMLALTKEESLMSRYPSYVKRSQYLSQNKVIPKAMELYKEATPDQVDDGEGLSFQRVETGNKFIYFIIITFKIQANILLSLY